MSLFAQLPKEITKTRAQKSYEDFFLILSGLSLIFSFFGSGRLSVDATWIAIVLCGMVKHTCSFLPEYDEEALFTRCAQAERLSGHPIGKAIVRAYKEKFGMLPAEPEDFSLLAGQGISARTKKHSLLAGNRELFPENNVAIPAGMHDAARVEQQTGATVVFISVDGIEAVYVSLTDTIREDAKDVISSLKQIGVVPVLLAGDHGQAACDIVGLVCIDEYQAECLPHMKLDHIGNLQTDGNAVCMVGDGINDAPALKKTYVGIAIWAVSAAISPMMPQTLFLCGMTFAIFRICFAYQSE